MLMTRLPRIRHTTPNGRPHFVRRHLQVGQLRHIRTTRVPLTIKIRARAHHHRQRIVTSHNRNILRHTPTANIRIRVTTNRHQSTRLSNRRRRVTRTTTIILPTVRLSHRPRTFNRNLLRPIATNGVVSYIQRPRHRRPQRELTRVLTRRLMLTFLHTTTNTNSRATRHLVTLRIFRRRRRFQPILSTGLTTSSRQRFSKFHHLPNPSGPKRNTFVNSHRNLVTLTFHPLGRFRYAKYTALRTRIQRAVRFNVINAIDVFNDISTRTGRPYDRDKPPSPATQWTRPY